MRSRAVAGLILVFTVLRAEAQNPIRGSSAVRGRVVDAAGQPVPGGMVWRNGGADTARADLAGVFLLGSLALGRHMFTAAAPGYQAIAFEVDFTAPDTATVDLPLERGGATAGGSLGRSGLGVTGKLESVGFVQRRAAGGGGSYFGPEDIAGSNAVKVSQLLEGTPDITLRPSSATMMLALGHDRRCLMNVWLDGNRLTNVFPTPGSAQGAQLTGLDEIMPLNNIAAIEVYARPSQVPERFTQQGEQAESRRGRSIQSGARAMAQGGGSCGAILIWSR